MVLKRFEEEGISSRKLGEQVKRATLLESLTIELERAEKVRYTYPDWISLGSKLDIPNQILKLKKGS